MTKESVVKKPVVEKLKWKRNYKVDKATGCVTLCAETKHYTWLILIDQHGYVASCKSKITGNTYYLNNRKYFSSLKKAREECQKKYDVLSKGEL
jgi:hypothetical protein